MVGAAFGQGQIDVWDVSAPDGTLKVMFQPQQQAPSLVLTSIQLLKQIPAGGTPGPVAGRQDSARKPLAHCISARLLL
jgi:hypothetical protein